MLPATQSQWNFVTAFFWYVLFGFIKIIWEAFTENRTPCEQTSDQLSKTVISFAALLVLDGEKWKCCLAFVGQEIY